MEKEMRFVKANTEHIDLIFAWANEETTRKNAFNTKQIPYEEHKKWYLSKINDGNTFFYVCKHDDKNVGQLRIVIEDNEAVISYSVDKNHRGKGFGKRILNYAEEVVRAYCSQNQRKMKLIGKVKHINVASQKCFRAMGYHEEPLDNYIEFTKLVS